jgi:hypothetical protein
MCFTVWRIWSGVPHLASTPAAVSGGIDESLLDEGAYQTPERERPDDFQGYFDPNYENFKSHRYLSLLTYLPRYLGYLASKLTK